MYCFKKFQIWKYVLDTWSSIFQNKKSYISTRLTHHPLKLYLLDWSSKFILSDRQKSWLKQLENHAKISEIYFKNLVDTLKNVKNLFVLQLKVIEYWKLDRFDKQEIDSAHNINFVRLSQVFLLSFSRHKENEKHSKYNVK